MPVYPGARRGRDDHHWSPPAQIRTGAFTHTALTVDEWRRNALLAAHRAIPGTCVPRSVSGTCVIERCSPQSVPFPPQPPPKTYCPSLCGWFTGTTAQSDFSCTCVSAVRFMAFADRPWSFDQGAQEISRFSCMLFLSVRGFLDYAGPSNPLAICVVAVLPSSSRNGVGILFHRLFEAQ